MWCVGALRDWKRQVDRSCHFFLFPRFIGLPSFSMASHSQLFINFWLSRPFLICQNSMRWAYWTFYWNVNPSLLTDVIFVWIVEGIDDGWSGCPFVHVDWLSQLVNVALSFKPKDGEKVAQEVVRMQEGQLKRKKTANQAFGLGFWWRVRPIGPLTASLWWSHT